MENENNEMTEQEKQELAKLYEKTVDGLEKQYERLKNPNPLAEAVEGMTDEAAERLAKMLKRDRLIREDMQKFYDDLVAFNPEGDEKPL